MEPSHLLPAVSLTPEATKAILRGWSFKDLFDPDNFFISINSSPLRGFSDLNLMMKNLTKRGARFNCSARFIRKTYSKFYRMWKKLLMVQ